MTTTTKRRPAKISKKSAVCKAVALFRIYDPETGVCLGYQAPSEDKYIEVYLEKYEKFVIVPVNYRITCDEYGDWHCTCDGNAVWSRECKHIKAAKELCKIRHDKGMPGCFQGKATAGVESNVEQAEETQAPAEPKAEMPVSKEHRDAVLAKIREESAAGLARIDAEVQAHIAAEIAEAVRNPKPKSEQARIADLGERGSLNGQRGFSLLR